MTSRWSLAHSSISATRHIDDQGIDVIVNRNAAAPNSLLAQQARQSMTA
jgi:HJR/Mrr/RecB family endonuclease